MMTTDLSVMIRTYPLPFLKIQLNISQDLLGNEKGCLYNEPMDIAKIATRGIPLQELPDWSPWPARMLGQAEWNVPHRDLKKVDSEYDKDEYLRCLTWTKQQATVPTTGEVRHAEYRINERKSFCVSQQEELYEVPADKVIPYDGEVLVEVMTPLMDGIDTIVEMGCGYGINLWELYKRFPEKQYRGGEYSANAIELARILYEKNPQIHIEHLNFYDDTYDVLERCKGQRVMVFTRHAIEQLPDASAFVKTLTKYFDRIQVVVHLEVTQENYGTNLIGLMRKRYIEINDYNRNLLTLLQEHEGIVIERNDPDVFGISPLNPTNVVVWRPRP